MKAPKKESFDQMNTAYLNQEPYDPPTAAWEGIALDPSPQAVSEWLERFKDIQPALLPVTPDTTPPVQSPVDNYESDRERTQAWIGGHDMTHANRWIGASAPSAFYAITVLYAHKKASLVEKEIWQFPGGWEIVLEFQREVVNGFDVITEAVWADTEAEIPVVVAIAHRDLLIRSVGVYGMRKIRDKEDGR